MFGYIKPFKPELKIKEYEYYRSSYCGLCNALRKRYGFFARFILNYDFAFAVVLLASAETGCCDVKKKRCIVCPFGKKCLISDSCDRVADVSVILSYLKLCDDILDNGFFKSFFKARIPRLFLKHAYKKAQKNAGEYFEQAKKLFSELALMERARIPSLDETADKFAKMLEAIVSDGGANSRIMRQILYHTGRFIYILDALDDFSEDVLKGEYNPISERFGIFSEDIPKEFSDEVVITLCHSQDAINKAFALLDENENSGLLKNIIELGMTNSINTVIRKEK